MNLIKLTEEELNEWDGLLCRIVDLTELRETLNFGHILSSELKEQTREAKKAKIKSRYSHGKLVLDVASSGVLATIDELGPEWFGEKILPESLSESDRNFADKPRRVYFSLAPLDHIINSGLFQYQDGLVYGVALPKDIDPKKLRHIPVQAIKRILVLEKDVDVLIKYLENCHYPLADEITINY